MPTWPVRQWVGDLCGSCPERGPNPISPIYPLRPPYRHDQGGNFDVNGPSTDYAPVGPRHLVRRLVYANPWVAPTTHDGNDQYYACGDIY